VCLIFSTSGLLIKLVSGVNPLLIAGLRSGIAAAAMWLLLRHRLAPITPRVMTTAVPYAVTLICFVASTTFTAASTSIFLQSTAPLYVLLLNVIVHKCVPSKSDIVMICLFGIGISMFFIGSPVLSGHAPNPRLGDLLGVLTGVFQGITLFMLADLTPDQPNKHRTLTAIVIGNILAFGACMPFTLHHISSVSTLAWIDIIYLGLFQIAFGYFLFSKCIEHPPAFQVSLILLLEPVFNSLWVGLVLKHWPRPIGMLGALLVLSACGIDISNRGIFRVQQALKR